MTQKRGRQTSALDNTDRHTNRRTDGRTNTPSTHTHTHTRLSVKIITSLSVNWARHDTTVICSKFLIAVAVHNKHRLKMNATKTDAYHSQHTRIINISKNILTAHVTMSTELDWTRSLFTTLCLRKRANFGKL